MLKNTAQTYGTVTKFFHWLVFLLVSAQFTFIVWKEQLLKDNPLRSTLMTLHKSTGFTLLFVAGLFIVWHLINKKPALPVSQSKMLKRVARLNEALLLALIFLMPLSGALMSFANGYGINWFYLIDVQPWPFVPQNESTAGFFASSHETIAILLAILIGIHIVAAFVHHFIFKDNVLRRMLPFAKVKHDT